MSEFHTNFADPLVLPDLARRQEEETPAGAGVGANLRPRTFDEYPGQDRVCANLKVYTQAAKMRGKMLDHCLFHGPPGLGKTTLAGIIASVMDCELITTSGPNIERPRDLMGVLASLESNAILFIDEIHRLPSHVEEVLYSAMEDNRLDLLVGEGPSARTVKFELKPFTLIGATTRPGALSAPLRDRFGIVEHLDFYSDEALARIILRSAGILNAAVSAPAALALAHRSRGTPRIANMLVRRVMDFALVAGQSNIEKDVVDAALERLGIDDGGLARMDREILRIIRDRHDSGPVGLEAVAAALNEERSTLEDVYEPYLVHKGYIVRTARGRMLSQLGTDHLRAAEKEFDSE